MTEEELAELEAHAKASPEFQSHEALGLIAEVRRLRSILLSLYRSPDWSDTSTDEVEAVLREAGLL